jgi:predicted RNase H-like nuclease (RuvC/YqgF family)
MTKFEQQLIETVKQLAETIAQNTERIEALEREINFLRATNRINRKESGNRIYVAEVARSACRFGRCEECKTILPDCIQSKGRRQPGEFISSARNTKNGLRGT